MAINETKSFSLNISLKQAGLVLLTFALCFVAIYWNALTLGYIVVTLVLCAFFLAVAFDLGINQSARQIDEDFGPEPQADEALVRRRNTRNARTA